jgi:hypothetical protein
MGFDVAAVSGVVTNSPLARREVEGCEVPCIPTARLGQEIASLKGWGQERSRTEQMDSVA